MKSKKGAEMTIGTLVVIALAILVLVTLIFGFTSGWGNLWKRINPTQTNVDSLRNSCQTDCITQQKFGYCCGIKNIVTETGAETTKGTCYSEKDGLLSTDCALECDDYIKSACPDVPEKLQSGE
jgi:hypothetical protein